MAFEGPTPFDYRNVSALNRAYLSLLPANRRARRSLYQLSPALSRRITSLTRHQAERLSATPFLLLSFRERDDKLWSQITSDDSGGDLFTRPVVDDLDRLRSAGLGVVWQLARPCACVRSSSSRPTPSGRPLSRSALSSCSWIRWSGLMPPPWSSRKRPPVRPPSESA